MISKLKNSRIIKTAFFVGGSGILLNFFDNYHQKHVFVRNMNLLFPHYDLPKKGISQLSSANKVVSRTQLEYIMKQCNQHKRDLGVYEGPAQRTRHPDILIDLRGMNQITNLDTK